MANSRIKKFDEFSSLHESNSKPVRVRFAPSPTGGLHLGGVRTALYNYLFAKKNGGKFILRIEDTDQKRFVPGAEQYIQDCFDWCQFFPDEGPNNSGSYGPYRQSERKDLYKKYAEQLVEAGYAYYAFDSAEDLEKKRTENSFFQYDFSSRDKLNNSLNKSKEETNKLKNGSYVIRFKTPVNETVSFTDLIRGQITFNTNELDDKVLLKKDGMPTYHLAVVVDDYLMKISHVLRGEEWLPSTPLHILLWRYLGWDDQMPAWGHLPLILNPRGEGKLSKRQATKFNFPIFPFNWKDPMTGEMVQGFKEAGFLPEAFVNIVALLGWNPNTTQEILSLDEMISQFSLDRVHQAGARLDLEKAKWFNQQWMQKVPVERLADELQKQISTHGHTATQPELIEICNLIKEKCVLLPDLWENSFFFFEAPNQIDKVSILPKWGEDKINFFTNFISIMGAENQWDASTIEQHCKSLASTQNIKVGDILMILRIMMVGKKIGPPIFNIISYLGKQETVRRIKKSLQILSETN